MEWKTEFATGIHNIDAQHRTIVDLITLFENLVETEARWDDVHSLILRTRRFIEFHFDVEESLMQLLPYPNLSRHRAEHLRELQTITDIDNRMSRKALKYQLAPQLRECLIDHITRGDLWLAQYARRLYGRPLAGDGNGRSAAPEGQI